MTENQQLLMQQTAPVEFQQDYHGLASLKTDELANFSALGSSFSADVNASGSDMQVRNTAVQLAGSGDGFSQAELDDLLNNKLAITTSAMNQIGEFDNCFKDMDGSKDNLAWWSNEVVLETNSASSNSWDSAGNMFQQSEEMYQDYGMGYGLQ